MMVLCNLFQLLSEHNFDEFHVNFIAWQPCACDCRSSSCFQILLLSVYISLREYFTFTMDEEKENEKNTEILWVNFGKFSEISNFGEAFLSQNILKLINYFKMKIKVWFETFVRAEVRSTQYSDEKCCLSAIIILPLCDIRLTF